MITDELKTVSLFERDHSSGVGVGKELCRGVAIGLAATNAAKFDRSNEVRSSTFTVGPPDKPGPIAGIASAYCVIVPWFPGSQKVPVDNPIFGSLLLELCH